MSYLRSDIQLAVETKALPLIQAVYKDATAVKITEVDRNQQDTSDIGVIRVSVVRAGSTQTLGSFHMQWLPHCCGVAIFGNMQTSYMVRNKGVGRVTAEVAKALAKALGFGTLICTDREDNTPMRKILRRTGALGLYSFINPRTNNRVNVSVYDLTGCGYRLYGLAAVYHGVSGRVRRFFLGGH